MQNKTESLNLFRIFAMTQILLFHAKIYYGFTVNNSVIDELIKVGAIGCTVFFMLSGFSLRYNYSGLKICNSQALKQFYVKRITSIYPAYLILLIVAVYFNIKDGVAISKLLQIMPIQLSLLQVIIFPGTYEYADNANFWFISALFVLYLLFPFLNEIANNLKTKQKVITLILLIFISEYFYYLSFSLGNVYLQYYPNPVLRIPEFFCGILMADISKEERVIKPFRGLYKLVVFSLVAIGLIYYVMPKYNLNIHVTFNLYNIIVIPFVTLSFLCMTSSEVLNKIGNNRIIKYIASLGLLIYLCQEIGIHLIASGWNKTTMSNSDFLY